MVCTLYVGCGDFTVNSNCYVAPTIEPDFTPINYSATTHLPGEYLVNMVRNIVIDPDTRCTRQVKAGYSLNLNDIPSDLGKSDAVLGGGFSMSHGIKPIIIDNDHTVPFDSRYTNLSSTIPKVMGKQFPFTGGQDHNIRKLFSDQELGNISKFSFKDYGFFDYVKKVNSSLQGLVRSVYSDRGDSYTEGAYGHEIVMRFGEPGRFLSDLPEPVHLQFVLRLSIAPYNGVHMQPNPPIETEFDGGKGFADRVLILYNFVFDPTIFVPEFPIISGSSWTLQQTYTSKIFMKSDGSVINNIYSHPFVKYSNNGLYALVGNPSTNLLMVYYSTVCLYKFSLSFTDGVISNNGSRFMIVNENNGKIVAMHLERKRFVTYYNSTYGSGFGHNIYMDDSGSIVLVSQTEGLYTDVFSGRVFTLRFDGRIWVKSVTFQSVLSNERHLGYGMAVSSDSVYVAYNKQRVDITTVPYTVLRFVELRKYITAGTYESIGMIEGDDDTFGNHMKISKNGKRLLVWSESYGIRVYEYTVNGWSQVGQALTGRGTNMSISDDGGSVLIDRRLYRLN